MNLTLEDLTKEELIKYIRQYQVIQPRQRDIIGLRWESLSTEAQRVMAQATTESQKWTGDKTIEGYRKWRDAQELFDKAMKLYEKADEVFKELVNPLQDKRE